MKEHPILFNAEMVRAILSVAKTQTRRIMKPQPPDDAEFQIADVLIDMEGQQAGFGVFWLDQDGGPIGDGQPTVCPYGQPGDRLWVRESTRMRYLPNILTGDPTDAKCGEYTADGMPVLNEDGFDLAWWYSRNACPNIHMPRWASRITLEVTGVRVERLQDISLADALAEGVVNQKRLTGYSKEGGCKWGPAEPIADYYALWEQINGPGSWDANPWVWVIQFQRMEKA